MTDPLSDDPVVVHERGFRRELAGLLLLLIGLSVVATVLSTVDIRLVYGLIGVVLTAGGIWLGRGED